jgi:hypothetical protein
MTYLLTLKQRTDSVRRLNVGGVLVRNDPPALGNVKPWPFLSVLERTHPPSPNMSLSDVQLKSSTSNQGLITRPLAGST